MVEATSQVEQKPVRWFSWRSKKFRKRVILHFVFTMHVLGLLTSIRAILETRTSQGAIAWGISLNTIPYFAVPAYWVFGQSSFSDYEILRLQNLLETSETGREAARILQNEGLIAEATSQEAEQQKLLLEHLAKFPVTTGNSAELLIDGEETFDAIFKAIASAEEYILVQFYIIKNDELGRKFRDALIERAKQGVRIYVLYDEVGSHKLKADYTNPLKDAGVYIYPFNTTQGDGNRFRLNFRNHRKVVVVDGDVAFVGGHNVGDEYLGKDPILSPWRDTHVQVSGPVVQFVQVSFVEDWIWARGSDRSVTFEGEHALSWLPKASTDGDINALCLPSGPADELETCTLFFLNLINSAKDRIWIVSPYFVPDEQLMSALQLAALRGIDVQVLIPENPDQQLVYYSSFSYLEEAEKAGVQVYRYKPGFLHQKVVLVDDNSSVIGTANFDNRSMRLNFEISMLFIDREFAKEVEKMLLKDFSESRLVAASEYSDASLQFKIAVRLSRLMAPVQ